MLFSLKNKQTNKQNQEESGTDQRREGVLSRALTTQRKG